MAPGKTVTILSSSRWLKAGEGQRVEWVEKHKLFASKLLETKQTHHSSSLVYNTFHFMLDARVITYKRFFIIFIICLITELVLVFIIFDSLNEVHILERPQLSPRFAAAGELGTLWKCQHFLTPLDLHLSELLDGLGLVYERLPVPDQLLLALPLPSLELGLSHALHSALIFFSAKIN